MARIEWDALPDGRFSAWATCAFEEDEPDFAFILDRGESAINLKFDFPRPVHACSRGGDAHDRAALPSDPPRRASSIVLDPDESG